MTRHYKAEILAMHIEGYVRPRKAAKISAHLGVCGRCTGTVSDLKRVPSLLASVPAPPMPDSLSARLESAVHTESRARVAADTASEAGRHALRSAPARPQRRWQLWSSSPVAGALAAAGAAVVLAGGGYLLASHVGAPVSTSSSAVHAPTRVSAAPAAAAAVAPGPSVVYRHASQAHSIDSIESATNFTASTLASQASAAVTAATSSAQHALMYSGSNVQAGVKVDLPQLEGCVSNISAGLDVLLVDIAKFDGKPATIIAVGTGPGRPGRVYAVGPSCSGTVSDILSQQYVSKI